MAEVDSTKKLNTCTDMRALDVRASIHDDFRGTMFGAFRNQPTIGKVMNVIHSHHSIKKRKCKLCYSYSQGTSDLGRNTGGAQAAKQW